MSKMINVFDQVKLQFHRLNTMWSPTGDVFNHHAAMHLRLAVATDNSMDSAIIQLHRARQQLLDSWMRWNEHARDPQMESWGNIYGAASTQLDLLVETLPRNMAAQIAS